MTLDGTVVQTTTLPDVRGFQRVSDTEIFVLEPDMVVWTDSAALVVQRWR